MQNKHKMFALGISPKMIDIWSVLDPDSFEQNYLKNKMHLCLIIIICKRIYNCVDNSSFFRYYPSLNSRCLRCMPYLPVSELRSVVHIVLWIWILSDFKIYLLENCKKNGEKENSWT